MTKILLVEDDKGLREIYGVRLLAEGYDIVSAGDGNEALAVAIKERPKLVITDIMMPQISGFEFLDILRSTTETKDIKVIMMTALSSQEQRERGERLGADRYLVKSQVGIEDVVRIVHEVLADQPSAADVAQAATPPAAAQPTTAPLVNSPAVSAVPPRPQPAVAVAPVPPQPVVQQPPATAPSMVPSGPAPMPTPGIAPSGPAPIVTPSLKNETPKPASLKSRVIQPLNDPYKPEFNLDELLDKELAKEAGITEDARPQIATTDQERDLINAQLANFAASTGMDESGSQGDLPTATVSEDGTFSAGQQTPAPSVVSIPSTPQPAATITQNPQATVAAPTPPAPITPSAPPTPSVPPLFTPIAPVQPLQPQPSIAQPPAAPMPQPLSLAMPPGRPVPPVAPPSVPPQPNVAPMQAPTPTATPSVPPSTSTAPNIMPPATPPNGQQ
jgi:CheY-like chemotaxis protein